MVLKYPFVLKVERIIRLSKYCDVVICQHLPQSLGETATWYVQCRSSSVVGVGILSCKKAAQVVLYIG